MFAITYLTDTLLNLLRRLHYISRQLFNCNPANFRMDGCLLLDPFDIGEDGIRVFQIAKVLIHFRLPPHPRHPSPSVRSADQKSVLKF